MKILLINHYAGGPQYGMEFRPHYLGRVWAGLGHDVTVVGASHSHLRRVNPPRAIPWAKEKVDGVAYQWLWTPAYTGSGMGRIFNMMAFVGTLLLLAPFYALQRPGVVIASSTYPIDIFPAWLIARLSGAKLVFELHDIWPLSPRELGGYSKWHPFIVMMGLGEKFAYRTADKVVSILPKAKEHALSVGMKADRFVHVPNGIWEDEWQATVPTPDAVAKEVQALRQEFPFVVGYLGGHSVSNALEFLVSSAPELEAQGIGVVLVGDGKDKAALEAQTKSLGVKNVRFVGAVAKASVPETLRLFDALYLGFRRLGLYRFGVGPNKLLDYMMAQKPVIFGIEAGNDLVAEAACGISIPPEDAGAIVRAARKLRDLAPNERREMGLAGGRFVRENHGYGALGRQFLDAVTGPKS